VGREVQAVFSPELKKSDTGRGWAAKKVPVLRPTAHRAIVDVG